MTIGGTASKEGKSSVGMPIRWRLSDVREHGGSGAVGEPRLAAMDGDPRLSSGAGVPQPDNAMDYVRMTGSTAGGVLAEPPRTSPRVRDAIRRCDPVQFRHSPPHRRSPEAQPAPLPPSGSRAAEMFREIIADLVAWEAEQDVNAGRESSAASTAPPEVLSRLDRDQARDGIETGAEPLEVAVDGDFQALAIPPADLSIDRKALREWSPLIDSSSELQNFASVAGVQAQECVAAAPLVVAVHVPIQSVGAGEQTMRDRLAQGHLEPARRRRNARKIARPYILVSILVAALVALLPASRIGQFEQTTPLEPGDAVANARPENALASKYPAETTPATSNLDAAKIQTANRSATKGEYSIAGYVSDQATGGRISGASIYVRSWHSSLERNYTELSANVQPRSRTNEAGEFFIDGLRAGVYGLTALHDNYVQVLPVVRHELQFGPNSNSCHISMLQGGFIEGQVKLLDRPAEFANLRLLRDGSVKFSSSATTDSKGRYLFENLPPGTYRLAATLLDEGRDFRESVRASVEPGLVTSVDFAFAERSGTILGRIRPYNPLLNYNVHAETLGGPIEWREADVDVAEDGVFIVTGLPSGQYRIGVESRLPGRHRWQTDAAAVVRRGEVALADFCFATNPTISGRILNMELDETPTVWITNRLRVAAVDPAVLERIDSDPDVYRAHVDRNGRFKFENPIEAGSYMVVAAGSGERYAVASLYVPSDSMRNVLWSDSATYIDLELSDDRKKPSAQ